MLIFRWGHASLLRLAWIPRYHEVAAIVREKTARCSFPRSLCGGERGCALMKQVVKTFLKND